VSFSRGDLVEQAKAPLIDEVSGEVGFGPRWLDLGSGVVTEGRKVAGEG
jgi:hypothetical protein